MRFPLVQVLHKYVIALIVVLALGLRLFQVSTSPASLYWEEVALGYDAYSILKTGKDHHGNAYPLVAFPSFGDYKPSGYFYFLVPFIVVFDLTPLAVRLPSALAGTLSVLLVYCIGKQMYSKKIAILAAFFCAIQPWNIHFSRGGFEVNLALFFILLGVWLLCKAAKNIWWIVPASFAFVLSIYTYHAARLFAPLIGLLGVGVLVYVKQMKLTYRELWAVLSAALLSLLLLFPFFQAFRSQEVWSRFATTSIFTQQEPLKASVTAIASHGGTVMARLLYHRYWYQGQVLLTQYLSFFSPHFLFWNGDGNLRHGTSKYGLLYPVQALFIGIGMVVYLKKRDKKVLLLLAGIALAALPGALVVSVPHSLRFLFASPSFAFLSALGLRVIFRLNTIIGRLFFVSLLVFVGLYLVDYYGAYRKRSEMDWVYGYEQVFTRIHEEKQDNERVIVSRKYGRPYMYYLFINRVDPTYVQEHASYWKKDPYQLELLQVDDYFFEDGIPPGGGLYATIPSDVPTDTTVQMVDTIVGLEGEPIWYIWRR